MANPNGTPENLRPKPWPKGVSGNPGGRPKKRFTDVLERELDNRPDLAEAFIKVAVKAALKGDFKFWAALYERVEGKLPTTSIEPEPATMPEDSATATPITTKDIADAAEILKGLGFKFHEKP